MPLIKEELQIEIEKLDEKKNELDKLIFGFNKENEKLDERIQNIENKIEDLREQKKQDDWQLTCLNVITIGLFKIFRNININSQIKTLKKKFKTLEIEKIENEKNKQPLKDSKLTILEKINICWKKLFTKNEIQKNQVILNKLDLILENQKNSKVIAGAIDYPSNKNPFEEEFSSTTLINSSVSDLPFDNNNNNYSEELNPFSESDEDDKSEFTNKLEEKNVI